MRSLQWETGLQGEQGLRGETGPIVSGFVLWEKVELVGDKLTVQARLLCCYGGFDDDIFGVDLTLNDLSDDFIDLMVPPHFEDTDVVDWLQADTYSLVGVLA